MHDQTAQASMTASESERLKSELLCDLQRVFRLDELASWRESIKRAYTRYALLTSDAAPMPFDVFVAVIHTTAISWDYQVRTKGRAVFDFLAFATDRLGIP